MSGIDEYTLERAALFIAGDLSSAHCIDCMDFDSVDQWRDAALALSNLRQALCPDAKERLIVLLTRVTEVLNYKMEEMNCAASDGTAGAGGVVGS